LPAVGIYKNERLILPDSLKKSFFDQLAIRLALKRGRGDIVSAIKSIAEKERRTTELEIFRLILNDKEKFALFIEEARRRVKSEKGNPSPTSVMEFSSFVKDLSRGKFGVVRIFVDPPHYYYHTTKDLLSLDFAGVYLLARGPYVEKLTKIEEEFIKQDKNLKIKGYEYGWELVDSKGSVKAKLVKVEKKKVKKKIKKIKKK